MAQRSPYVLRSGVTSEAVLRGGYRRRMSPLSIAAAALPRKVWSTRTIHVWELTHINSWAFEAIGDAVKRAHTQSAHQLQRRVSRAQPAGRWASLEKIEQAVHGNTLADDPQSWIHIWMPLNNFFAVLLDQFGSAIAEDFLKGSTLL